MAKITLVLTSHPKVVFYTYLMEHKELLGSSRRTYPDRAFAYLIWHKCFINNSICCFSYSFARRCSKSSPEGKGDVKRLAHTCRETQPGDVLTAKMCRSISDFERL